MCVCVCVCVCVNNIDIKKNILNEGFRFHSV